MIQISKFIILKSSFDQERARLKQALFDLKEATLF